MEESPLRHKTRKNTAKNWNTIARTRELSLFKDFLHNCGRTGILAKQLKNTQQNNQMYATFPKRQKNT